jgi:hypothetical protein
VERNACCCRSHSKSIYEASVILADDLTLPPLRDARPSAIHLAQFDLARHSFYRA